MFTNTAYKENNISPLVDFSKALTINSCGVYQVFSGNTVLTERPEGRNDWQLLYIDSGEATFVINSVTQTVQKGSLILFPPRQPQYYYYHKKNKPIIYWIHFSGREIEKIFHHYNLDTSIGISYIGVRHNLPSCFRQIIDEMRLKNEKYEELIVFKFHEILLNVNRALKSITIKDNDTTTLIKYAKTYFNENYNQEINIENYANSLNMTTCWFIKKFKEMTGLTPTQYILKIRLTTAQNLLRYSKYNVSEAAEAVGYSNSFYFSRLFTKHFGVSPSKYKSQVETNSDNSTEQ